MTIQSDVQTLADKKRARLLQGYFKTGKGEYGEGDVFIGLTVPQVRAIAKKYQDLPLREVETLLRSAIHEYRLTALCILYNQFLKATDGSKKKIYNFYLANTKWINNWDLVDLSAKYIIGGYLFEKKTEQKILYKLATSNSVWERRIAVLGTFLFIDNNDFGASLRLAEMLLHDPHDLMQKAVGWMLREIGKRDEKVLVDYLSTRYKTMPRTMLRYAIEKFSPVRREKYLKGTV